MNSLKAKILKRFFDFSLSVILIVILILPGFVLTVLIALSFKENPIFKQERIGKDARAFYLYKFRTIGGDVPKTVNNPDLQLTVLSKFLLRYNLNEIPQLFNILRGDMSFVGPRPDVSGYADKLCGEDLILLTVKPGLTGPATLKYRNEATLLNQHPDPEEFNKEIIWPDKVKINRAYIENWSFSKDIKILLKTVFLC